MELQCKVQKYDWGKLGNQSIVAKLLSSANKKEEIEENTPYAELWVGTHPNGPSLIIERGVYLSDYLKDNLDAIGPDCRKRFGIDVPFLLKVLSIRKALSIQAHPNKEHAEQLHKLLPDMYKDPNHKPELAIALTPFEALCGFRPLAEIKEFCDKLPELSELLPKDVFADVRDSDTEKASLKRAFEALMTTDKAAIKNALNNLISRLEKEAPLAQSSLQYPLVRALGADFPADVGCLAPYFMNHVRLRPGQAVFLGPNLPHAYLSGDCIECMACSDNVVRAGLTPKHIDVPTLVNMLDYSSYTVDQVLFTPQMEDPNSCIWRPPVPDFAVVKIKVTGEPYNTIIRASPSLLLVAAGAGAACDAEPVPLAPGVALFLKASRQLTLTPADGHTLEVYQAICNV